MSSWQMFFLGGGKCPNLGVVNVRILGVVNVLLANDSQSFELKEMESITHIDSDLATAVANDTMSDKTVSTVLSTQEYEEPHLVQIW